MILDSSLLIADEREGFDLPAWLQGRPPEPVAVSVITFSEFWFGIEVETDGARTRRRRRWAEKLFRRLEVVPVDVRVARIHASLGATNGFRPDGRTTRPDRGRDGHAAPLGGCHLQCPRIPPHPRVGGCGAINRWRSPIFGLVRKQPAGGTGGTARGIHPAGPSARPHALGRTQRVMAVQRSCGLKSAHLSEWSRPPALGIRNDGRPRRLLAKSKRSGRTRCCARDGHTPGVPASGSATSATCRSSREHVISDRFRSAGNSPNGLNIKDLYYASWADLRQEGALGKPRLGCKPRAATRAESRSGEAVQSVG